MVKKNVTVLLWGKKSITAEKIIKIKYFFHKFGKNSARESSQNRQKKK